jgi:hypothetical protein
MRFSPNPAPTLSTYARAALIRAALERKGLGRNQYNPALNAALTSVKRARKTEGLKRRRKRAGLGFTG